MGNRENFGSKMGAILAAAGSAVGLGNIWRFPIETGNHGGAAFILVYIICVVLFGLPIMMSEFIIGRKTQSNTAKAYRDLAPNTYWNWVGRLGVMTGLFIFSYYSVVAGWTIQYAFLAITNAFSGTTDYNKMFADFSANPYLPVVMLIVFMLVTHYVIVRGVKSGIERYSKILMPMLFIIIVVLVVCSACMPGASGGLEFLLKPDFSKLSGEVILSAMGQAFFSLSVGMGCLCTYASYFKRDTHIGKTAISVASIDTIIAVMAGFIIFPAVTSAGMDVKNLESGPGLIFITLPHVFQTAFSSVPALGYVFSVMFYLLLIVAALTSTISMHEVVTAYFSEEFSMSRKKGASIVTGSCIFLGIFCALSFGVLSDFKIFGMTIFGLFDFISSNILLPLGGMLISIFTGWYLNKRFVYHELTNGETVRAPYFKLFIYVLRYVAPVAIGLIFLNELNVKFQLV